MLRCSQLSSRRRNSPPSADIRQAFAREKPAGFHTQIQGKKSASAMGMPSSTFLSELTGGTDLICSIREINSAGDASALRQFTLRQTVHLCLTRFQAVPTSMLILSIIIDGFGRCRGS